MTRFDHLLRRCAPLIVGLAGLVPTAGLVSAQDPVSSPIQTVRRLTNALQDIAKIEADDHVSRRARLAPDVEATHDFELIASELTGEWWKALEPGQRQQLARSLTSLATATYAGRLLEFGGLSMEPVGEHSEEPGLVQVACPLQYGDGKAIPVAFAVRKLDDAWRIVNVLIDERDGLASERERWRGFLEARDLPGLTAALDAEAASFGATPTQVVARLQDALMDAMKTAKQRAFPQRFARLAPTVEATHDLEGIAKLTVSRAWKDLTGAQQVEFLGTFRELTLATYAGRFDGFSGESFVRESEKEVRDAVQVVSRLVRPKKDPIRFEYLLRRSGGRWQILNIVVDGVSDLATKRSEYKTVLERDGFSGLVAKLRRQIEDQAAGKGND